MTNDPALLEHVASVPRVRAAAGALLCDGAGRVLVVHPVYKDIWEIPGGMVEKDESPLAALRRELREELGIVREGQLVCVDWVPPTPPWDAGLMFMFDCGVLAPDEVAALHLPADELDRFAFVEPDGLDDVLVPRLARRLKAALAASAAGRAVYAEDGVTDEVLPRG